MGLACLKNVSFQYRIYQVYPFLPKNKAAFLLWLWRGVDLSCGATLTSMKHVSYLASAYWWNELMLQAFMILESMIEVCQSIRLGQSLVPFALWQVKSQWKRNCPPIWWPKLSQDHVLTSQSWTKLPLWKVDYFLNQKKKDRMLHVLWHEVETDHVTLGLLQTPTGEWSLTQPPSSRLAVKKQSQSILR